MISIDIAILTLNEEKYLKNCLDSVVDFLLPDNVLTEIYIIDGGSTDKTLDIAENFKKNHQKVSILHNKEKIQSTGMNLLISEGNGDYILRLDSHCIYSQGYLKNCLETSLRTNADNVGGVIETLAGSSSYGSLVVQALTTHIFGVGNSGFRVGAKEGFVDTVPFGFFKSSIFQEVGLYDERLLRAQDYEMNRRIIKQGGTIFLNPDIKAKYFNQPSFLKFLRKIFFFEAPYNAYMWYFAPYTFALRHSVTALFTLGVIGGIMISPFSALLFNIYLLVMGFYFVLAIFSSIQQALRFKNWKHAIVLPFSFFIFHLIHGVGILLGFINIILNKIPKS